MDTLLKRWSAATAACLVLSLGLTVVESATITVEPGGDTTIQIALDNVNPGDTIIIKSGDYFEDLVTVTSGTEDERITIKGANGSSGKEDVVLRGAGVQSRVFQLKHEYYTLQDFTIDGQVWDDDELEDVDEDNASDAYRDILLYVAAAGLPSERSGGYMSALDGLIINGMVFKHAISECVRVRNFVTYAEISDNVISDCGLGDFVYAEDDDDEETGVNGEGIYLGTARAQWTDTTNNPSGTEDICLGTVIKDNEIKTNGNEGVDVKEGCMGTIIKDNDISMQRDANAGGISSHADDTTIIGNTISHAAGAGVRIGTSEPDDDGRYYGIDNTVTGNIMVNCTSYGIKIVSRPQTLLCGNKAELPEGETENTYKYSGGDYADDYEAFEACDRTPAPSANPNTPAPSPMPNTVAPSPAPNTLAPSPAPSTPAPSHMPNTLAPSPASSTPAPSPMPSTLAPSPAPNTLAPSPALSTPAPSPMPNTLAPSPSPNTPALSLAPSTPAPSPMPNTLAPSPAPSTPAPSPMPNTLAPSPTPSTPAPSPMPNTLAPSPAPSTPAPSPAPNTPAPSPMPITLAPSPAPSTPAPSPMPITLAPSAMPSTTAPSSMPSTVAPSAMPSTVAPSAMPTTVAPSSMPPIADSDTITVEPGGETIQSALDRVSPGGTINIESGTYFEDLVTTVDGTEDARITIQGVGGAENVILRGSGDGSKLFEVMHDYYTIQDFTIDGQVWDDVGDVDYEDAPDAFRDNLLYVAAPRTETERGGGYMSALDGLIVSGMILQNAGKECLRLRHFATYALIDGNSIHDCGLIDWEYGGHTGYGQSIHIGTPRDDWDGADNYSGGEDICRGNVISNNVIMTDGNEGVDVKEGCLDTAIEYNIIAMQNDPDSAAVYSRGDGTTIIGNTIADADGAGVIVGSATPDDDGRYYGLNNIVTGNTIENCFASGVTIMSSPQGDICGNEVVLPDHETEDTYNYSGGTYGSEYKPFQSCSNVAPTPSTPAPSATFVTPAPSPVVSTPAPTLIPGAVYLGCFLDKLGERTMDIMAYKSEKNLTNEECIDHCREEGQRFAGTMYGFMCRCTNYESNVYWHGEADNCNMECPQESAMPCGGDLAVTSWEVTLDSSSLQSKGKY